MINLSKHKGEYFFLETQESMENLITLKQSLENHKVTFIQCDMLDDIDMKVLFKTLEDTMDTVVFDDFDKSSEEIKENILKMAFGMNLTNVVIVGKEEEIPSVLMKKMIKL